MKRCSAGVQGPRAGRCCQAQAWRSWQSLQSLLKHRRQKPRWVLWRAIAAGFATLPSSSSSYTHLGNIKSQLGTCRWESAVSKQAYQGQFCTTNMQLSVQLRHCRQSCSMSNHGHTHTCLHTLFRAALLKAKPIPTQLKQCTRPSTAVRALSPSPPVA